MGYFYHEQDKNSVDYHMTKLGGEYFRGPKLDRSDYIAYLGAAQTFGRHCKRPFPNLIGDELDIGTLNLGSGGKGPLYYLKHEFLIEATNRAQLAVVQIMSGRSTGNSEFRSNIGGDTGICLRDGNQMKAIHLFRDLWDKGKKRKLRMLLKESKNNYVNEMIALLQMINVPKILLWISVRSPEDVQPGKSFHNLIGQFPHLIDRSIINQLKPYSDSYVECTSDAGLPQKIFDKQENLVGENVYYPSPEMHLIAASKLLPDCRQLRGMLESGV